MKRVIGMSVLLATQFAVADAPPSKNSPDLRCGAYCLYVALKSLDAPVGRFDELQQALGSPTALGYSMDQLAEAAKSRGVFSLGVQTGLDQIESRAGRFACIALLEKAGHFVCIYDLDDKSVFLADPPTLREVDRQTFAKSWSGKALLISRQELFPIATRPSRIWWVLGAVVALMVLVGIVALRFTRSWRRENVSHA